jgi:hypothetical protein
MQEDTQERAGTITANGRTIDEAGDDLFHQIEPSRVYHDPPTIPPPPTMAKGPARRRERWVKLPTTSDYGYQGWMVYMWVNFPSAFLQSIDDMSADERSALMSKIFMKHNGWQDFDGNEYPQPGAEVPDGEPDFWEAIPQEVANALVILMSVEQKQLSFLVNDKPRISRRS